MSSRRARMANLFSSRRESNTPPTSSCKSNRRATQLAPSYYKSTNSQTVRTQFLLDGSDDSQGNSPVLTSNPKMRRLFIADDPDEGHETLPSGGIGPSEDLGEASQERIDKGMKKVEEVPNAEGDFSPIPNF
ncbi:hypothetical protein Salat_1459400 [Sesamum alatum]|uniref:Uncharacterized protein n=1 Tax=Sesamum alatum TaxID=300844 RepID=A0AAE2CLS6_9LAMI|nr:hypothetical protein Salat_1459400 [Sesamum alatum]